jgi:hypothetical protein
MGEMAKWLKQDGKKKEDFLAVVKALALSAGSGKI